MSKRYLIAMDFDGTLFDTFSPSPNGMDVRRAYDLAFRDIFGELRTRPIDYNNTPSELIANLLNGNDSFNRNSSETLVSLLIQKKLSYLTDEIGKCDMDGRMWPYPCEEALLFLNTVYRLKQQGCPIDSAVISSGHEAFIRKVFQVNETPCPDILVTEDDIRTRKYPKETERRFKPGQLPLALAHFRWLKNQGFNRETNSLVREGANTKPNIMYVGDSPTKDALMANRGKVLFYLFPQTPWSAITECLLARSYLLDGRPISEVFLPSLLAPDSITRLKGGPERC